MTKRMIVMIVVLIVVLGGLFGYRAFVNMKIDEFLAARKPPPVTVSTRVVQPRTWTPSLEATGSLRAVRGVQIPSEVGGTVVSIDFESGARVEQGDRLVALDTSVEEAQLASLRAQLELARQTLERKQALRERGLGTEADLDQAQATFRRFQAEIAVVKATIDKKRIEAPFAGKLGLRLVDLGQYLAPGAPIVTLQALDPMLLDFDLPQGALANISVGQRVELTTDAYPDRVFEGRILAISPQVSEATRSFGVRATLHNPDELLRPGMFGEVRVELDAAREVLTLPQTAISYNPYGDYVYVVEKVQNESGESTLVAAQINVRTGETRGDQVQIVEGLEAGAEVVIIGHHKLYNNAVVNVDNERVPKVQAHPQNVENY